MSVFWIETSATNSLGRVVAYPFECKSGSVEELAEELATRGIVCGMQLYLVDDGRGGRLVQRRKPVAFTAKGLARVSNYDFRVWEPEEGETA